MLKVYVETVVLFFASIRFVELWSGVVKVCFAENATLWLEQSILAFIVGQLALCCLWLMFRSGIVALDVYIETFSVEYGISHDKP